MAGGKDKNYIPIWFWMLAMFVMAIPCVGLGMIVVWAFTGENESRKNYFKALIIWFFIWTVALAVLLGCGFLPGLVQQFQHWPH